MDEVFIEVENIDKCIVCLEECKIKVENYRINEGGCSCKYNIHKECLERYMRMNGDIMYCMVCKRELLYTNENYACIILKSPLVCIYFCMLSVLVLVSIMVSYNLFMDR